MRIAILNNLRAGASGAQVSRILDYLVHHPDVIHIETDRAGVVPDAIDSIADQEVDLLIVNGGDGTLQFALTEILTNTSFETLPMVAPLCGGRTNMTATDFGCTRDPVKGLAALVESAKAGTIHERVVDRPVLRVEFDHGRRVEYGMFFGAGVIHRAIALTHSVFPAGKSQGAFGAGIVTAVLLARAAFSKKEGIIRPDKIQALIDGESARHGEYTLLMASSLQRLFLKLNPFWGEGKGGVRFTSIAASAERLARAAPGIVRGRPPAYVKPETGYTSVNAEHVALRFDCGFTVDGEIFPERLDEYAEIRADRRITFVRS